MFQSARRTLTAWYLLIIMLISIFFSIAFYHATTHEMNRIIGKIRIFEEKVGRVGDDHHPRFFIKFIGPGTPPQLPTIEELQAAKHRILVSLIVINGIIFILAGGAGYFLAGRTLRPIKEIIDEQNRFITDSSHELRTPLTALRAEMETTLLDKKLTAKEAKTLIASNLEEVIRLQSLSDNLLQLAQYQNKQKTPIHGVVSLLEVLEHALKKVTPLAKRKHMLIENNIEDAEITGDVNSLVQLFVIFLENAVKYSPEKTKITLTSEKTAHSVTVHIKDQGMGISNKDLPRIFDRFYRTDKSRSNSDVSGYGLGLSIAQKIVMLHKGTITVKSRINKGTTFSIQLPASHT